MSRRVWFGVWVAGAVVVASSLFLVPIFLRPASRPVAAPAVIETPSPIPARSPAPSPSPLPSVPPTEPDPHALPVVIVASELGFIAAKTEPGAVCTATANLGGDLGLEHPRTANAYGRVEFSYHPTGTLPGTGQGVHTVSCALGDRHGVSVSTYNASGA